MKPGVPGVSIERAWADYQFRLPLGAVSLRAPKPPTEAQVQARARSIQKARRSGRSKRQNTSSTAPTTAPGDPQA